MDDSSNELVSRAGSGIADLGENMMASTISVASKCYHDGACGGARKV